jgi:hypothetical protein
MSEIVAEHGTRRRGAPAAPSAGLGVAAADLAFSDLVLWVLDRDPDVFWAAAQIRPTTGPTTLADDVAGDLIAYPPEHLVWTAYLTGRSRRPVGEGCGPACRWTCTQCR